MGPSGSWVVVWWECNGTRFLVVLVMVGVLIVAVVAGLLVSRCWLVSTTSCLEATESVSSASSVVFTVLG